MVTINQKEYPIAVVDGENQFEFKVSQIIGYTPNDKGEPDVEEGDQSDFEARVRELLSDIRDRIEQFLEEGGFYK